MNGLDYIISLVRESNIFKRNKVPLEDIVLAALLHYSGLSLRSILDGRLSYEAIRQ
ncbi:transposase (fragment) [Candidatus Nitrosocaldus cavascurensis]|jgi:hypothetical protein|uniref:Transposase n=1 Tax=Candidatus Nitrosocaldus cavascurensis TaxID=2058097 RepID=A0A2K5ASH5_9ARCH